MSQTLSGYITEVRRLLHDASGNFYTDSQLTDYINSARDRIVRDTGCLRQIQITQVPCTPVPGGAAPVMWAANTYVTTGQYLMYNIFLYEVIAPGTTASVPPPYPAQNQNYPPSSPFYNGTAELQYAGPAEVINVSCLPAGTQTLDVLNINLFWGNTRIPMRYLPWTQFNAQLRFWQNNVQRPIAFSAFGQNQIFVGPVPDEIYTIEVDSVVLPLPLVYSTDVDSINNPYTNPVKFYAAYLAKYYEQSFGEAEIFKQEYKTQTQAVLVSTYTRRIPDPYSTPF